MTFRPSPEPEERAARRRRRELDRQEILFETASERHRALYEVERYENRLAVLRSLHEERRRVVDWSALANADEPPPPEPSSLHEAEAQQAIDDYEPGFFERLFGGAERARARLHEELDNARQTDTWAYEQARARHEVELESLRSKRTLAERVLESDLAAFREVIDRVDPFTEIRELGSRVELEAELGVEIHIETRRVIPNETKSIANDGNLRRRPMTEQQTKTLQLAHACSCALRIAADMFALLPLDTVVVTARDASAELIVSATIPRGPFEALDLSTVDATRLVTSGEW